MESSNKGCGVATLDLARELIDAAHDADPVRADGGMASERLYADRVERWLLRLHPDALPLLRLAARCQHLERWTVPRATYPSGKAGYFAWRQELYRKQADRARELMTSAGIPPEKADEAAAWISKTGLMTNPGTQALEDAACLVFLENEAAAFAQQHENYPREKFIRILQKIWRKMSPAARQAAAALDVPPSIADLLRDCYAKQ